MTRAAPKTWHRRPADVLTDGSIAIDLFAGNEDMSGTLMPRFIASRTWHRRPADVLTDRSTFAGLFLVIEDTSETLVPRLIATRRVECTSHTPGIT